MPQVGLGKSDSYLMTLSPASSSEQPVVTGGLKGAEARVQVIDLWPQRSASGAEGVVLPQWEPRGTHNSGAVLHSLLFMSVSLIPQILCLLTAACPLTSPVSTFAFTY